MSAAVRRCLECGAVQTDDASEGGRCPECRAMLRLAPVAIARGPAGWCPHHPDRPITGVCAGCGAFTCTACDVPVRGIRYCESCRSHLRRTLVAPVAWEERRTIGRPRSWWRTTAGVISRPDTFFDQLDPNRDVAAAMGYALVGALLHRSLWMGQSLLTGGWVLIQGVVAALTSSGGGSGPGSSAVAMLLQPAGAAGAYLVLSLLAPLATFGMFLAVASLQHLALRIVGAGQEHGFPGTLKVACYSLGGTGWMGFLPVIGPLLQAVWWTVLMVLGTARVHQRSTTRTLVVVLPMALFCGAPIAAVGVAGLLAMLTP
jgi:hypothetical protein